ncbi:MAG: hypothetical protein Q9170_005108 [Blastenia crenularia]
MGRKSKSPAKEDISDMFTEPNGRNLGGFGNYNAGVFVVRGKRTGTNYVAKYFKTEDIIKGVAEFEMFVMKELIHENIVRYVAGFIDERPRRAPTACMYMEYCDRGNLHDYLGNLFRSGSLPDEGWVWNMFIQLVNAIAFIQFGIQDACNNSEEPKHWIGVVHRDIKPDNIFLCSTPESDRLRLCLGDFGVAIREDDNGNWGRQYIGGNAMTMPPEVNTGGWSQYSYKSDNWAVGACISMMCNPLEKVNKRKGPGPGYSKSLNKAVAQLMQIDASQRPQMKVLASNMRKWEAQGLMSKLQEGRLR